MAPIALNVPRTVAATGSRPGILYGLPKIHKTGIPLLPILSAIVLVPTT